MEVEDGMPTLFVKIKALTTVNREIIELIDSISAEWVPISFVLGFEPEGGELKLTAKKQSALFLISSWRWDDELAALPDRFKTTIDCTECHSFIELSRLNDKLAALVPEDFGYSDISVAEARLILTTLERIQVAVGQLHEQLQPFEGHLAEAQRLVAEANQALAKLSKLPFQRNPSCFTFSRAFGCGGSGKGQMRHPRGIAVDPTTGNLFVVERDNNRVQVFDAQGGSLFMFGEKGSGPGQFDGPLGIAVDSSRGRVAVTDWGNRRVQVFSSADGTFEFDFGSQGVDGGQLMRPVGVAVDRMGKILVADYSASLVHLFDSRGHLVHSLGSPQPLGSGSSVGRSPTGLNHPTGVAVDAEGNIFVTEWDGHRVQMFDSNYHWTRSVGGPGHELAGQLNNPWGVAVMEASGYLLVADRSNHRVQVINLSDGRFVCAFSTKGMDNSPSDSRGIAVDPKRSKLYVSDSERNHVQVFTW